ncbi:MAG: molybdenum cofactor guanylyltransferase [Rhizobiales bacterium]|nr:molybdenum cofactor guanylyltransferase [Hyphomicrobiales bacterium]MBO6698931.1 molybdenum cofactor guanylyltransferase [Hyphomicrobiales bacterium]MBO6734816.1 molybdenum cofactor guanylyltransferase [Hyphomicrobiales bacterium]MBO6911378.1 molybdenum cofactor guanylyltransferase [Hyphomicrobiales bacterium]MBO6955489.1 molybdenum cofactor guanylyltransferase [Hyphomicrobiales bacterium]
MRIAAILTGGKSRRMGEDKALLDLGGERLVDRVIARLAPQVDRVCLVGPIDYGTGLATVADDPNFQGPLAGIFGMLAWMQEHHAEADAFLTAPVDTPHCPNDLYEKLTEMPGSAMAADAKRIHPTFAHWHVSELVKAREGVDASGSLHSLAEAVGAWPVAWPSGAPFLNLNTPEEAQSFLASEEAAG